MTNLLEIIRMLTRKKIAKIEILDEQTLKSKDSKFGILYEALVTGKIASDEEAAQMLYGTSDTTDAKYRQLKSRFKRRLYNTLFFMDVNAPLASNRAQAQFNSNKEWALVEIMLAYEIRNPAIALARQILTTALKFHFPDLIVRSARLLREQSVLDEDAKAFERYDQLLAQYYPILEMEVRAETLSQETLLACQAKPVEDATLRRIENMGNELIRLTEKTDARMVQYHMFTVWVLYYELLREFDHMLEVCQQAMDFVNNGKDYFTERQKAFFLIKKFSVYLHLQQYRQGKIEAETILNELVLGSPDWLDFMELYFLLSLHTGNLINTLAVYNKVGDSPAFKKLDDLRREKWLLFEAFLHYFIETDKLNPELLLRQRRNAFKINHFISQPVNYTAGLAVLSVHQIILKILFLLERRNYAALSKQTSELRKLSNYELKKKGYERTYAMARLIFLLEKAQFQPDDLHNAEKYLQQLKAHPFCYRGKVAELEVIPYEKLWQMLCRHLA